VISDSSRASSRGQRRAIHPAAFIHGANRIFIAEWRAQLAHQDHIKFTLQLAGDALPHRHRATRYGQHQRPGAAVTMQMLRKLACSIVTVAKALSLPHGDGDGDGVSQGSLLKISA
jgi:hypothetical protein